MSIARIQYKKYFTNDNFLGLFEVNFFGPDADILYNQWKQIKNERFNQNKEKIKDLHIKVHSLREEADLLESNLHDNKPWWRLWHTQSEKEVVKTIAEKRYEADRLQGLCENIENSCILTHDVLLQKPESFLIKNKFSRKDSTEVGKDYILHTDIWEK